MAPFWDAQAGIGVDVHRTDGGGRATRGHLVFGFQGLAPYWFELEPSLLISHEGDVASRLHASYQILLTQRLIVEPEFEANFAFHAAPRFGVGSGWNDVGLRARLRYEIARELAPYIGVTWLHRIGHTADLARERDEKTRQASFVTGLRWWW